LPFTLEVPPPYVISGQVTFSGSALAGDTGTISGSAVTGSSGNYSLPAAGGGQSFQNLAANQTANFAAQCAYSLSSSALYLDSAAQAVTLSVTTGSPRAWSASAGDFVSITSGAARIGQITIAGQTLSVIQRDTAQIFSDVAPIDYYFDFADVLDKDGITAGCQASPPQYCPNDSITRGEMAVFLVTSVMGGSQFTYTATPYFTDVPPSYMFFKFIQKLRDLGIIVGCSATEFCPDAPVTRGEWPRSLFAPVTKRPPTLTL